MDKRVEVILRAVTNPTTPWVLFSHGTIVFLPGQDDRLEETATQVLKDWGPVQAGSPSGDFRVIGFDEGWFVGCHHPDILTLVTSDQVSPGAPDPEVGLLGRGHRDRDAQGPQVVHIQEARAAEAQLENLPPGVELSDEPTMADAQKALLKGNPGPLTELLMAGGHWLSLEWEGEGATVYREERLPTYLPGPWAQYYGRWVKSRFLTCDGPRGLEVRTRGGFYAVTSRRVPEYRLPMLAVGVEHTGRMRGAASQAVVATFDPAIEKMAQSELANTDRSLGTVVFTPQPMEEHWSGRAWFALVVSTPKHTPKSPGWLKLAVPRILDKMAEDGIQEAVLVALGTNGGISSEDCASLMIGESQRWFESNKAALRVVFSLPDSGIRKAFEDEFRRRKIFFTEL